MKIDGNKIIEATELEVYDLWLKNGYDDIMSFDDFLRRCKYKGIVISE